MKRLFTYVKISVLASFFLVEDRCVLWFLYPARKIMILPAVLSLKLISSVEKITFLYEYDKL